MVFGDKLDVVDTLRWLFFELKYYTGGKTAKKQGKFTGHRFSAK